METVDQKVEQYGGSHNRMRAPVLRKARELNGSTSVLTRASFFFLLGNTYL